MHASEGLSVIVLDPRAFGGQAGASARIENYLGFPTGISGMALAGRAFVQAQKFGAEMRDSGHHVKVAALHGAASIAPSASNFADGLARDRGARGGDRQRRALSPARAQSNTDRLRKPRRLLLGRRRSRPNWRDASEVVLVGGGNSAGQAAIYLSGQPPPMST